MSCKIAQGRINKLQAQAKVEGATDLSSITYNDVNDLFKKEYKAVHGEEPPSPFAVKVDNISDLEVHPKLSARLEELRQKDIKNNEKVFTEDGKLKTKDGLEVMIGGAEMFRIADGVADLNKRLPVFEAGSNTRSKTMTINEIINDGNLKEFFDKLDVHEFKNLHGLYEVTNAQSTIA